MPIMNARAFPLILVALVLGACLNVNEPDEIPSDPATETYAPVTGVDISKMSKTELGVYYKDVVVGDGAQLTQRRPVTITFVGYLRTGDIFDRAPSPRVYDLNSLGVIGVADGMIGMRIGGTRKLVIPSNLAFGARGQPGLGVPSNSTVIYDITLLELP
jgi:FKBP-type peptidyl-prolyl cis-trans isomerase FkpA